MYVKVIKCEPTPATEGSKIPDETPTPEYTPPSGDPPVRLNGEVVTQTALKGEKETLG